MSRANPIRRPALARSRPIRHFAGVFGARPAAKAQAGKADDGAAPPAGGDKSGAAGGPNRNRNQANGRNQTNPGTPPKKKAADPGAAVARGVNAGYRVIEEYLRQGQEFARSLWPGSASGGDGAPDAPLNMTERLIRSASDLAGLFSEFLQTFSLPGTLPPPGSTPIPDFGIDRPPFSGAAPAARARGTTGTSSTAVAADARPSGAPAAATAEATTAFSLDLRSRRRTEVTVNLRAGAWSGALHVHDLRPKDGTARLTGVTATGVPGDRRVVVAARVPDDLPAATYSGLIVDADTNLPQGTLAIRIFAGEASERPDPGKPAKPAKPDKPGKTGKARARGSARASK